MMEIGEFARLGGVSARMLRHYDRIGLLTPARTEPNGRRGYGADQLARLHLDKENRMNVQLKHLDAVIVAGLTTTAPRDSVDLEALFDRVIARMAGADRTAPIARIESVDEATVEITAGYVVPADSVPGLETRRLPAVTVASTIHQGLMTDLPYDVLRDWAGDRDRGCWRQLFLEADGDQDHWIVELQLELDHAA
ncbi:MerR family DNA-binding transcriptional regulator [Kribbella sp. NPDC059898]|uniref:MerR family transcriptional regulator n=1 Tax=Kribbella sp. NPDC059898 TaxID=3346995 RepID=UPI0036472A7B